MTEQIPRQPRHVSLPTWRRSRVLIDLITGLLALWLAFQLRLSLPLPLTESILPARKIQFLAPAALLVAVSQNAVLYFLGFYDHAHSQSRIARMRSLFAAIVAQSAGLASFYFFTERVFPRSVLLIFAVFNLILLVASRGIQDRLIAPPRRRAIVVGQGPAALDLATDLAQHDRYGLVIQGHVSVDPAPQPTPSSAARVGNDGPEGASLLAANDALGTYLGTVSDLPGLVARGVADEIIVAGEMESWQTDLVDQLSRLRSQRASLLLFPGPFDALVGRMHYRSVHDIPLIEVVPDSSWTQGGIARRVIDVGLAATLLTLLSPILALCAVAIRLTSRGPVFYRQTRVGRNRQPFTLWKLRTMHVGAEREEEVLARPDDPRKTAIGSILRAFRIDEIPQLFNVINGSMSLVGPRPERPGFVRRFLDEVPGYGIRFAVRPGLTGLAQVNGDYQSSADNKLRFDLAYLANWSLLLDLSILLRTMRIVLTSKGI